MGVIKLSREELYNMVWTTPITELANQFEVSVLRIKSACTEKKIPLPEQGYWEKVKYNKDVTIDDLPIDKSYWVNVPIYLTPTAELPFNKIRSIQSDIEAANKKYLIVPEKLAGADKIVLEAKKVLLAKKASKYSRNNGFISTEAYQLSIFVTKNNILRSLRIANAFIRLVRSRGHQFGSEKSNSTVIIDGEKYPFSIREKLNIIKTGDKWNPNNYEPSGMLIISVGEHSRKREFTDDNHLLEKKLSKVLAYLEYVTEDWKAKMSFHEAQDKIRQEEERKLLEVKKKEQEEHLKFRKLLRDSNKWHQARKMDEFINEFEMLSKEKGELTDETLTWIIWARSKVENFNPVKRTVG